MNPVFSHCLWKKTGFFLSPFLNCQDDYSSKGRNYQGWLEKVQAGTFFYQNGFCATQDRVGALRPATIAKHRNPMPNTQGEQVGIFFSWGHTSMEACSQKRILQQNDVLYVRWGPCCDFQWISIDWYIFFYQENPLFAKPDFLCVSC